MDTLFKILEICIFPLLGALTAYAIKWINAKSDNIKALTKNEVAQSYIQKITDIVTMCVVSTNQTYVDSLKKQNTFTVEAQEEAFNKTFTEVKKLLSAELLNFINQAYGDIDTYLIPLIEQKVKEWK